jgi:ubiquinone/menaquinone biosynthesis C-methylase UbiE
VVTSINSLDHLNDVDAAIREMVRVVAPGGMILLLVEIHPKPTIAEPHALPWDLAHRFGQAMRGIEERHIEKSTDKLHRLSEQRPFDHDDNTERGGILIAKMVKRAHCEDDQRGCG